MLNIVRLNKQQFEEVACKFGFANVINAYREIPCRNVFYMTSGILFVHDEDVEFFDKTAVDYQGMLSIAKIKREIEDELKDRKQKDQQ